MNIITSDPRWQLHSRVYTQLGSLNLFKNVAGSTKRWAQPNGSLGCWRGTCWAAWLGRQLLGWHPHPISPCSMHMTMLYPSNTKANAQFKQNVKPLCPQCKLQLLGRTDRTEALTASQHNKHTRPRSRRLHSVPCLEMAPPHSNQYGNGHIVPQGPPKSLSRSLSCRRKELPLLHTGCSPLPCSHCPVLTD